ncbi:MAG: hypothetical protein FWC27_09775, partial [Firmicutes bacterium]|nr:hypothetical protein [Bacillota bacterium]
MKTRIACLLLIAMLLALSACGATQPTNAPEAETSGETSVFDMESFPSEEFTTEDETEQETTADGESAAGGTTVAGETRAKTEVKAPVGGSATQVVEFYNTYASAVKAANRITITKHNVSEMTMDVPAIMSAFMPSDAGGMDPNRNETITETFVNGKGTKDTSRKLNDFMPVSGKSYVSALKASHVKSATCEKQGDGWIVRINLKDEPMDMSNMAMNQDMSEAERQKAMDTYLLGSGYGSSMEMSFGGGAGGFGGERPSGDGQDRQLPGNFDASSMSMDGTLQNGTIVALFNKDGQL